MIAFLGQLSPLASQMALVSAGLAVLVSVGVILLSNYAVRRVAQRRTLLPKQKKDPLQTIKTPWFKEFREKFWLGGEADDISKSFQQTLHILKTYLGDRQFKYRIPWYVMMGAEGSGKSTLLHTTPLDLPIGRPIYDLKGEGAKLDWWFFDQGIVIDLAGKFVLERNTTKFQQSQWGHFLNALNRFRPQRPLDGILLTISTSELLNLSMEKCVERAKALSERLSTMQAALAIRLPVYVIITKTDLIPGFSALSQELSEENLSEIFGWSSPYGTEKNYVPVWGEEMFTTMLSALRRARATLYARTIARDQDDREAAFVFPKHFMKLSSGIQTMCDTLFKTTAFYDSFFLRGVYFTGDSYIAPIHPHSSDVQETQEAQEETSDTQTTEAQEDKENRVGAQPSFFHHLLKEKVFPEGGLAQPIRRILVSTSRALNFSKIVVASIAVSWSIQLMIDRVYLQKLSFQMRPILEKIDHTLNSITRLSHCTQRPQLEIFLNEQAEKLIHMMSQIKHLTATCLGIPASWDYYFDERVRQSIGIAYDQIILQAIHLELSKKAKDISSYRQQPSPIIYRFDAEENVLNLPTFQKLNSYVHAIEELEANVHLYNGLDKNQRIHDLIHILKFLYHSTPPAQFFENTAYYEKILARRHGKHVLLNTYREHAQKTLRQLVLRFMQEAFQMQHTLPAMYLAIMRIDSLMRPTTYMNADRLRDILQDMEKLKEQLSYTTVRWIEGKAFEPGEAYHKLLTGIARSNLLGLSLADETATHLEEGFKLYKRQLSQIKTNLTGPLLKTEKADLLMAPSESLTKLIELMKTFLETSFMSKDVAQSQITPVPPGKILLWDEVALQSAATLVDEYNTFVTSELNQVNPELRTVFKIVARNQIRTKVMNLIARAQTYIDEPINTLSLRRRGFLTNQVQNFKSVLPLFATLLGSFESGGFILTSSGVRELILNQCYTILRKADAILQADGLYQVRGNTLSWWGGEEYLGFYAFGVHDNDGMSAYLSAQREQMTILAQEIVQPVLEFLSLGHLERAPEDLPLVMVWRRIIKQLEAYDRKEPENSVALLEEYVSVTMNQLQVHQAVIDKPFKEGDFFLKRRRAIQKLVQERTLTLARTNLYKTYNKIANFFNVSLAGLYPFTDKEKMNVSDARPEDVNTLLKFLSLMTPADMATLDAEHKTSKEAEQAFLFINHLKVLRPLLQVTLDKQFDQSIQKIDFSVAFRTNKAHENLVGQATEWSFISGISTIDRRSEQITLPWSTGDTLLVSFKFAASSHYNPMVDRSQQLLIDNKSAQFVYTGKWGLIRLIQHHQIIMQPEKPGVFRLRFQIPMQFYDVTVKKIVKHTQGFVFFTDIGFSLADNEPLMRQIPPPFPTRAPLLGHTL